MMGKIMKHQKFIQIIIVACSLISFLNVEAQDVVLPAGGDILGAEGSISFSIGQIDYTTRTNNQGSVSEGIQQAFEIFLMDSTNGADKIDNIQLLAAVFPNPADHSLTLQIHENDYSNWNLFLYDVDGRLLFQKAIVESETNINMSMLKPAAYIIKVMNRSDQVKTFKIIKK